MNFNPVINVNIQNDNRATAQSTDPSLTKDLAEIRQLLTQLSDELRDKLRDFVETLPEPETPEEKEGTGRQILKWLNKNAEGIAVNVSASVYYDALKILLGF